jgi:hypothetical protein
MLGKPPGGGGGRPAPWGMLGRGGGKPPVGGVPVALKGGGKGRPPWAPGAVFVRLVSLGFGWNGIVLGGHVRGSMPGAPGAPGGGMPKGGGGIWPGRPF